MQRMNLWFTGQFKIDTINMRIYLRNHLKFLRKSATSRLTFEDASNIPLFNQGTSQVPQNLSNVVALQEEPLTN